MISALAWIPRGAAKAVPEVAEVTEAEIAAMKAAAAEDVEDGAGRAPTQSQIGRAHV